MSSSASIQVLGGAGSPAIANYATNPNLTNALGGVGGSGGYIVVMSPNFSIDVAAYQYAGGVSGAPVGSVTNISANTWTSTTGGITVPRGVSFGGINNGWGVTLNAGTFTFTRNTYPGGYITRSFSPVG